MLRIGPGKKPGSPRVAHRHSQGFPRSSLGNELPYRPRFIMSTTQLNRERDCTCSRVPVFPEDSQMGRCGLPHAVPGGRSQGLDY